MKIARVFINTSIIIVCLILVISMILMIGIPVVNNMVASRVAKILKIHLYPIIQRLLTAFPELESLPETVTACNILEQ